MEYAAPEVLELKGYDEKSEMWACGVLFNNLIERAFGENVLKRQESTDSHKSNGAYYTHDLYLMNLFPRQTKGNSINKN